MRGVNIPNITRPAKLTAVWPEGIELNTDSNTPGTNNVEFNASYITGQVISVNGGMC